MEAPRLGKIESPSINTSHNPATTSKLPVVQCSANLIGCSVIPVALRSQATSLEGPTLASEEGWALSEEATCAAAFAALDAVRKRGVLARKLAGYTGIMTSGNRTSCTATRGPTMRVKSRYLGTACRGGVSCQACLPRAHAADSLPAFNEQTVCVCRSATPPPPRMLHRLPRVLKLYGPAMPRVHLQVHRCGVLHGDIALRNFVLAAQPAGVGGSAAGGGGGGGGRSQTSATGHQPQLQPRVMLLDFGHSQLLAEAAEEWGEEPASLIQRERRALQDLLDWEPSCLLPVPLPSVGTDVGSGTGAAAASAGAGDDDTGGQAQHPQPGMPKTDTDTAMSGSSAAAGRPGPLAAQRSAGPLSAVPPPPQWPPSRPSTWRQHLRFSRQQVLQVPRPLAWTALNGSRSGSRLSLRSIM